MGFDCYKLITKSLVDRGVVVCICVVDRSCDDSYRTIKLYIGFSPCEIIVTQLRRALHQIILTANQDVSRDSCFDMRKRVDK